MIRLTGIVLLIWLAMVQAVVADEPIPPQIADLYLTDVALEPMTLADGQSVVYVRQRVDPKTRSLTRSLWRVDAGQEPRALDAGEPDAFGLQRSPDGKWILFLSARSFPDGTPAFKPVPPYSDTAVDIWLIPTTGGAAIPLAGPGKPYGRVITDQFYGRVCFSPDGKKLMFVADEGKDPRTEQERRNNVLIVREDQGEGYEGYGPTQVWVADLLDEPGEVAAKTITKITPGDYWYGEPQWSPDGSFVVVHANRTPEQESVRYSINHNYDLWKITLKDNKLEQLTKGPGPEFSPRISPDGKRLVCLSSPRNKGPHRDVYNLTVVELNEDGATERVLFDHHQPQADKPPHRSPEYPLPEVCWLDNQRVTFNSIQGVKTVPQAVNLDVGPAAITVELPSAPGRSPLLPASNPKIGKRQRGEVDVIHWKSFDGLEIEGILTTPPASVAKPPYKLLVMPHGGPHHRAASGHGFDAQFFATRGFAVFQPNFRGSTGYGLKFLDADRNDFGGGDMQDILTGIDDLVKQGIADPKRQFVYGVSYGGYMTSWLVGQTHQFRAAVAQNAVTDLNVMWHLSDLQSWTEYDMSGYPWEVPERMRKHSPLTYAHQVKTPTLILHATNDRRCPVAMGKMFYRALKESGVDTQMVLYPDEGHPIRQLPHREDVLLRILDWFEKHDVETDSQGKARSE
ncbi:MAG: S9 family peptidase [Planctomycetota bacterium]